MDMTEDEQQKSRSIIRGNLVGIINTDQIDKIVDNIIEDLERVLNSEFSSQRTAENMDIKEGKT